MSDNDDTNKRSRTDADGEIASAYGKHYPLLEYLVTRKFRIPEHDSRAVIHDVFVAFIRNYERIRDERSWLVGAACIQSRLYWRERGGDQNLCELDEDLSPAVLADDIAARVDLSNVLRDLPRRCRDLLHLRFVEQRSSEEIASRYDTTIDYARKLVHRCVVNARNLFAVRKGRGRER